MKTMLLIAFWSVGYVGAQALPVVPMQMDPEQIAHSFVSVPGDQARYCNAKTGTPISGKSFPIGLQQP